ncbi:MAG: hypothetical protein WAK31_06065 [Chthoniobacterales bacterium]
MTQILSVGAQIDWLWNNGVGQQRSVGLFAGAACCRLIELPTDKAAPLQALGSATLSRRNPLEYEYEDD